MNDIGTYSPYHTSSSINWSLIPLKGLKPPTLRSEVECSIQLSYRGVLQFTTGYCVCQGLWWGEAHFDVIGWFTRPPYTTRICWSEWVSNPHSGQSQGASRCSKHPPLKRTIASRYRFSLLSRYHYSQASATAP